MITSLQSIPNRSNSLQIKNNSLDLRNTAFCNVFIQYSWWRSSASHGRNQENNRQMLRNLHHIITKAYYIILYPLAKILKSFLHDARSYSRSLIFSVSPTFCFDTRSLLESPTATKRRRRRCDPPHWDTSDNEISSRDKPVGHEWKRFVVFVAFYQSVVRYQ